MTVSHLFYNATGLAWWVLFLPLAAACLIAICTRSQPKLSGALALGAVMTSFAFSIRIATLLWNEPAEAPLAESSIRWLFTSGFSAEFGVSLNSLSVLMLLIVTGISTLIFVYSLEYMERDTGFSRYYAYLSLFVFSMLGIVLATNFLQLFIFWELVGTSSYLLIGFWYEKPAAADAGKKAFLTNRVGDFGFLIGILLLWSLSGGETSGTLHFETLAKQLPALAAGHATGITAAALLVFMGVLGKSAQFPLHVWLPDAMEGPTPVSALIHAATMVAAGVYLLARVFFLFSLSPIALQTIAATGIFTAVFTATLAVVQTDLKRILAYSTLSQLGFMVMAIGLGGPGIGMNHLGTHAFFKALLFLAAGSVIHGTHKQDINQLGGTAPKMPVTTVLFLIGSFALAGVWPFSGFWSKDEILALAYEQNGFFFWISVITAGLTAFYITRAAILTFFGNRKLKNPAHESGWKMLVPMAALGLLSIAGGFFGMGELVQENLNHAAHPSTIVIALGVLASTLGILSAFFIYQLNPKLADSIRKKLAGIYDLLIQKYFVDYFYDLVLEKIQKPFSQWCEWFEQTVVIKTMVGGTARLTAACGNTVRTLQTGRIQTYVTVFFGGVMVLLYWLFIL